MAHFLNDLTENGGMSRCVAVIQHNEWQLIPSLDEDANIPRSHAPMSLEEYVTVKPAGRKARTQDRSRRPQQHERQFQTQASAKPPTKPTVHQQIPVSRTEHQAEVHRESPFPRRQRTPSTLLGLTDMIHQIPSMPPLSALDVEMFFGAPSVSICCCVLSSIHMTHAPTERV